MNYWANNKSDIYISLYDDFASSLKTKDEIKFLENIFGKKEAIIEFGCGTGRTLIPLLKLGYNIAGLDLSKAMLKRLKHKLKEANLKTEVFAKNLAKFHLKKKFDGGILSQRTLNFITSPEDQRNALKNVAKVLKKGGILVINLMPARPDDFASVQKELKKTGTFINSVTNNKVEFWENWIPEPMKQLWNFANEFREGKNKAAVKMKMRIIFESEMKNLLEICGFKTEKIYGNWKKRKYDTNASDMIILARKI